MKNVFVLADLALATSKQLSALGVGEIGAFGIDTDNTWKPVASNTTAKFVGFAIGNGTAAPYRTPLIQTDVLNYSLTTAAYAADVHASLVCTPDITGYTANALDQITLVLETESPNNNDSKARETFTIVGKATVASIASQMAATINQLSKNYTCTSNSTTFTVTAKDLGVIRYSYYVERYDGALTPLPTIAFTTYTPPTFGSGTPDRIKELVDRALGHLGNTETIYSYDRPVPRQAVTGTKYTTLTFGYKENKVTEPTRDTDYPYIELVFACDVTAGNPSTLVADLTTFISTVFE
jgi:hypothetical protein